MDQEKFFPSQIQKESSGKSEAKQAKKEDKNQENKKQTKKFNKGIKKSEKQKESKKKIQKSKIPRHIINRPNNIQQLKINNKVDEYIFYIKVRFPYEFHPVQTTQLKNKKTTVYYIDSFYNFFLKGQRVRPRLYTNRKISDQDQDQDQESLNEILQNQLTNIQSIFMTSKGFNIYPGLNLIQSVKRYNKNAKICIEVNEVSQKQKFKQSNIQVIQPANKGLSPTLMKQYWQKIKQYWQKNQQNKPLIFVTPKPQKIKLQVTHHKIWLIKFNEPDKKYIRIVIGSQNFQQIGWKYGTNMFWVGQFDIDDNIQIGNLQLQDNYNQQYYNLFEENLNENFIQTLKLMFRNQIQWKILQKLNIRINRIKAKNINFVLIPSIPCNNNQKTPDLLNIYGLSKVKKYTQKYIKKLQPQITKHIMCIATPNLHKTPLHLINKIYDSFVPKINNMERRQKSLRIVYPTNQFIYERIKQQCQLSQPTFLQQILNGFFAKKQKQQQNSLRTLKTIIQQSKITIDSPVKIYKFISQTNQKYKIHKHRRMQGYTIPHVKTYSVCFRQYNHINKQEQRNKYRNIFLFGSHGLTKAAWQSKPNENTSNNSYNHYVNNSELSLLFFDICGIYEYILPFTIDTGANQGKLSIYDYTDKVLSKQLQYLPLDQTNYQKWKKQIQPVQDQVTKVKTQLKRLIQKQGNNCYLDYPIIQQLGKQCIQLKQYCQKSESLKIKYQSYCIKMQQNQSKRNKLKNQGRNPDKYFCFKNYLSVILNADAVIFKKNQAELQEIWYVKKQFTKDFNKKIDQDVKKLYKNKKINSYVVQDREKFLLQCQLPFIDIRSLPFVKKIQ